MRMFFIGCGIGMIIITALHVSPVKASNRNPYMILGDKFLRAADNSFGCECTQANAIAAFAAFTAAKIEEEK